jgi:GMP synthase-like glutamine amidotransferase
MRVHWFQHVSFEGLGLIGPWLTSHGHSLTSTRWWAGESAPEDAAFDALIIMGGPMNIYQHAEHPWLTDEKTAIHAAIRAGKPVLGVCLGAQLISDVLGGKVTRNAEREIGWWPVRPVGAADASRFALPAATTVLHWHGDTFSLPDGARWLARSEACEQQAFAWGTHVLAWQFHLEMDAAAIAAIAEGCADELAGGDRWVQSPAELIAGADRHGEASAALLDHWLRVWTASAR